MNRPLTRENHFVPEWYQDGFKLPDQGEFFVLNKNPDYYVDIGAGKRKLVKGKEVIPRGSKKFLRLKDLYTTTILGKPNDEIERLLFGRIDDIGAKAVDAIKKFPFELRMRESSFPSEMGNPTEHMVALTEYLDAQKWRTPKGLDRIKEMGASVDRLPMSQNKLMYMLQRIRQYFCTTLAEGLWELVTADEFEIKFIFSDDPVTIYNCDHFPGSQNCLYPADPHPFELGSRTIFPLDINNCLIVSNIEHAKNPERKNARKHRRNARSYDQTLMSYLDVHKNRSLNDNEVATINYIVKTRAKQFVAGGKVDWLYPERMLRSTSWASLDATLQHKGFAWLLASGETIIRFKDDTILTTNPFGERDTVPGLFVRQKEKR